MEPTIKLSDLNIRKELIISDFKFFFDATLTERDRINSVRQWEITVFVVIIGFALNQSNLEGYFPIFYGIIATFAILEVVVEVGCA